MTREELLFVSLGEEASEVAQCVAKILRFGRDTISPEGTSNVHKLKQELSDLMALVEMLQSEEALPTVVFHHEMIKAKKSKVEEMLKRSKTMGRLG